MSRVACVALVVVAGCAQWAPQKVSNGIARLSVRTAGGVLIAANFDEACGFASPDVIASPAVAGELGSKGSATWTVEDCTIDLGSEPVELTTDCNGVTTFASGRVTLTARKVVSGHLTGDPEAPVFPETAEAAVFHLDKASFADFTVTKSNSDSHMRVIEGSLGTVITPRLAMEVEERACSVITPHILFEDLQWSPATVEVTSGKKVFEVPLAGGTLSAVNGTVGDRENWVEGSLTVWKKTKEVLLEGLEDGLDPDYDPAVLTESFTCKEELVLPVTQACPIEPILAENAARLVIKNFGLISKTIDLDTDCGFGSLTEQVLELITSGALAGLFTGELETLQFEADQCRVGGDPHLIYTDCVGSEYFLDGYATVTGTKTVTGKVVLSADPLQPVDRDSALVELTEVLIEELTPLERPAASDYEPHLTLHTGTYSGTYHPVTGEAADTPGAFFIVIPVGEFERIRLRDSDVTLRSGAKTFPMHIDDTDLYAFTGGYQDQANWLYGTITLAGSTYEVGASDSPVLLDPDFDQAAFDLSYECIDNLLEVVPTD
jgi:hypothetical protein